MSTTQVPNTLSPAAETPQPATALEPAAIVAQLRALRLQMGEVTPLTPDQRNFVRARARVSNSIMQASINVIDAKDIIAQGVGQPAGEVRDLYEESNRWTAVEDELRMLLSGVSGANLVRRQRLAFIVGQAYKLGTSLSLDPANAILVPHVREIRRLKSVERRKKPAPAPEPNPSPAPAPGTSTSPQTPAPGTSAPPATPPVAK